MGDWGCLEGGRSRMNPSKGHSGDYWFARLKSVLIDGGVVLLLLLVWQLASNSSIAIDFLKITSVRWDAIPNNFEYKHLGPLGVFDVVVRYSRGDQSTAKLIANIGTISKAISLQTIQPGEFRETILRSLPISSGSMFRFSLVGEGAMLKGLELFPVGKNRLKPQGVESFDTFSLPCFFLGLYNSSLADLLMRFIFLGVLYQLLCFRHIGASVGMKLQKLKVVGRTDNKISLALYRSAGSVLTLLSLGLGSLQAFFSPYRQSWADLLSDTYVVKEGEQVFLEKRPDNFNIFSDPKSILGYYERVPLGMTLLAFILDALCVVLVFVVGFWMATTFLEVNRLPHVVRMEAEDFELTNVAVKGSLEASGGKVIQQAKVGGGLLSQKFRGMGGAYAVILGYFSADASGRCDIALGSTRIRYRFDEAKNELNRVLLFPRVTVNRDESVEVRLGRSASGKSRVDYIEFWPLDANLQGDADKQVWEFWDYGRLGYGRLASLVNRPAYFLIALSVCFLAYLLLFVVCVGRSLGTQLVGIELVMEGQTSSSCRSRLAALADQVSSNLAIFGGTAKRGHRLRWWFLR